MCIVKGGNRMAEQVVKPFHFDLSETLYFHRNEGVSEMLGIGLDPEITIESHPDHVSVRGIIALTGEYVPVFVDDQTEVEDDEGIQSRYFKRVERDDEGICDFLHHFPIDISIPHERIKNLADLTVSVDHFDYRIPDSRKLELEAKVQIDGLEYARHAEVDEDETDVENDEVEQDDPINKTDERIHFDIKLQEEEPEQVATSNEKDVQDQAEEKVVAKEEVEKIVHFKQRTEPVLLEEERGRSESDAGDEDAPEETKRAEQANYLLDLFDRDEESGEGYSQMRMYIVQNEDSLEAVAEKYELSVAKMQRVNRLESSVVYQGQVLYVPN